MGKFLFVFFFLGIVMMGTLGIKKYRVSEQSLHNKDSFVAQLVSEASELGEAFFLRQLSPPDPEEVNRFKKAVSREIERLNTIRREARPESFTASNPGAKPSSSTFVPQSGSRADNGQIR